MDYQNPAGGVEMTKLAVQPVILPKIVRCYSADVPLRLIDPGKWSDVTRFLELIGGGAVLNICGRLRVWGSDDVFSGIRVEVKVLEPSIHGGRINVRAGADPSYNATCTFDQLKDRLFDHRELVLCVLSTLDFSSLGACDLDISIISPILPGASLGTSASLGVAINRAFLGEAHNPLDIAMRTLKAELEICGKPTGNQDHLAAAYGSTLSPKSPAIMIMIRDISDVDVVRVPVGPNISRWLENTVVVFLGSHDSSEIHRELGEHLDRNLDRAKELLIAMRDTAIETKKALLSDVPELFICSMEKLSQAQTSLSPDLISKVAKQLFNKSLCYGGIAVVPGAGGAGGSVVCCFPDRFHADNFVRSAQETHPDLRYYEAQCPGIV